MKCGECGAYSDQPCKFWCKTKVHLAQPSAEVVARVRAQPAAMAVTPAAHGLKVETTAFETAFSAPEVPDLAEEVRTLSADDGPEEPVSVEVLSAQPSVPDACTHLPAQYSFVLDKIEFFGDHRIKNVFVGPRRVGAIGGAFRTTDFPGRRLPVGEPIQRAVPVTIQLAACSPDPLRFRLVGRRGGGLVQAMVAERQVEFPARRRETYLSMLALASDAEVAPGHVVSVAGQMQWAFRGEALAVDGEDWWLVEAEIGRRPAARGAKKSFVGQQLRAGEMLAVPVFNAALPGTEIRLVIRNASAEPRRFAGRLYGPGLM